MEARQRREEEATKGLGGRIRRSNNRFVPGRGWGANRVGSDRLNGSQSCELVPPSYWWGVCWYAYLGPYKFLSNGIVACAPFSSHVLFASFSYFMWWSRRRQV